MGVAPSLNSSSLGSALTTLGAVCGGGEVLFAAPTLEVDPGGVSDLRAAIAQCIAGWELRVERGAKREEREVRAGEKEEGETDSADLGNKVSSFLLVSTTLLETLAYSFVLHEQGTRTTRLNQVLWNPTHLSLSLDLHCDECILQMCN